MNKITFQRYDEDSDVSLDLEEILDTIFTSKKAIVPIVKIIKTEEYPFKFQEDLRPDKRVISRSFFEHISTFWTSEKFDVSTSSRIEKRKSELLKAINALQSCLDGPTERHIQYFRFKEELKRMRDIIDSEHWDLLRLIIGCIDATTNTQAADLSLSQVEAFKKVIEQIKMDIDCSAANSLLNILISVGLKPVPDLRNLEPIEI